MNYNVVIVLFTWDPKKNSINVIKHRISFEFAATVFSDPLHLSVIDKKSSDEERWITIGRSMNLSTIIVVHTYMTHGKQEFIRIISARVATRREKRQYEEGI
ncbi:MAG: BrnT family toxin [Deltaproteobacteria bacterium]|nr:BrnT family toxin [Deltaproteobacteria bacterium]